MKYCMFLQYHLSIHYIIYEVLLLLASLLVITETAVMEHVSLWVMNMVFSPQSRPVRGMGKIPGLLLIFPTISGQEAARVTYNDLWITCVLGRACLLWKLGSISGVQPCSADATGHFLPSAVLPFHVDIKSKISNYVK